ncbi:hypothetical protein BJ742DRAFT_138759 [Cladochytrium replicatum]|nr:hypothetical protein BJ742DRAFT_138759 [Cladochytrium replicatum]
MGFCGANISVHVQAIKGMLPTIHLFSYESPQRAAENNMTDSQRKLLSISAPFLHCNCTKHYDIEQVTRETISLRLLLTFFLKLKQALPPYSCVAQEQQWLERLLSTEVPSSLCYFFSAVYVVFDLLFLISAHDAVRTYYDAPFKWNYPRHLYALTLIAFYASMTVAPVTICIAKNVGRMLCAMGIPVVLLSQLWLILLIGTVPPPRMC